MKSLAAPTLGALLLIAAGAAGDSALSVVQPPPALSHRDRLYDVAAAGDSVFVVGHPGRILRAPAAGVGEFMDVDAGQKDEALFSIAFNAAGKGAIVGRSGYVLVSADKGASWRKQTLTLDEEHPSMFAVEVLPSGVLVAVGEFGLIVRSETGGETWTRSTFTIEVPALSEAQVGKCAKEGGADNDNADVVQESRLTDVHFSDEQHGYAVGEFGLILRSEDGGRTFTRQNSCTGSMLYGLALISDQRALAVGADGNVVETSDAGKTWLPRTTNTSEHLFGVYADGQRAMVVGAAGTVLQRQGDAPFSPVKTDVHTWLTSAWMNAQGQGVIAGGRANLLRTEDGGKTQTRKYGE